MRQGKHWKKTCWKKIRMGLLTASAAVLVMGMTAFAEEGNGNGAVQGTGGAGGVEEGDAYTYTVRLNAGNQGELTGDGITAPGGASIQREGDWLVVKGLKYGDTLYMVPQDAVKVTDERYDVRGVRRSGRDNSDATESTFTVASDRDYVIAYYVAGDRVAYTVNYLDADGNQLLGSDTYYGKPGERQYVSARYVEGYTPNALNMVMTLSTNEAGNVFNFRYTPIPTPGSTTETGPTTTEATPAPTPGGTEEGTTTPEGGETPGGEETPTPGGEETPEPPIGGDANLPDENVPQGTQDLDNLEDGEVPLSNEALNSDRPGTVMSYLPIYAGIGIAVVVILAAAAFYIKKKGVKVKSTKLPEDILHDEDRK
ncbi:MAG: MucBP domain-containing protein [Coprococcus sp.]|nr:MucBP domain-containing protein [Coprococcus sp.]